VKPITLTPALQTGDATVDAQHRALITIANEVLRQDEVDDRTFLKGLAFLSRYVRHHFAAEEEAMVRTGYPDLENHQQHHAQIAGRIEDLIRQVDDYGVRPEVRGAFRDLIEDWITFHLTLLDRHLVQHMQGRGESVRPASDPEGDLAEVDAVVEDAGRRADEAQADRLGARLRRLWQRVTGAGVG